MRKQNGYWTLEKCKEEALKYSSKTEWFKASSSSYNAAKTHNWFDECVAHMIMKVRPIYSIEECKEIALRYKSSSEWENNSSGSYSAALRNNWLVDCCSHFVLKQKKSGHWNLQNCQIEALKFKTRGEWQDKSASSYGSALAKGFLEDCCQHMEQIVKPSNHWTFDNCKSEALKYSSKAEWKKHSNSSYLTSSRNKWVKELSSHMKRPKSHNLKWSLELCIEDAKKYKTKEEWRSIKGSGYTIASKNKWLDQCCGHMKKMGGTSMAEQEILTLVKQEYPSARSKRFTTHTDQFIASLFELDIFIPELNKGIEYNGKYWHSIEGLKKSHPTWNHEEILKYHEVKDSFFKSKNINVLYINETDWKANKQDQISKIKLFIT